MSCAIYLADGCVWSWIGVLYACGLFTGGLLYIPGGQVDRYLMPSVFSDGSLAQDVRCSHLMAERFTMLGTKFG